MITNSQEYNEKLWQIQSDAPTTKAILLPGSEPIYEIDLNTRSISTPKFLSVEKDHHAETIYFKFDRFYEHIDLTTKCCIIQYVNAAGNSYLYPVPFYDVETLGNEKKVIIPWCIQGAATEKEGTVKFAICFYSVNLDHEVTYCLNTLVAQSEVLNGQNIKELDDYTEYQVFADPSLLEKIQYLKDLYDSADGFAIYWRDAF